jgi:hypothetical protein
LRGKKEERKGEMAARGREKGWLGFARESLFGWERGR